MKSVAKISTTLSLCTAILLTSASVEAQQQTTRPQYQPRPTTKVSPRPTTPQQRRAVGPVAVIDMNKVFKSHAGFKAAMDKMKGEVQTFETGLRQRHEKLQKAQQALRASQFKPGTPNFVKEERRIADEAAQVQVDTQLKKQEFLQRESKAYFTVYQQIQGAIAGYAQQNRISIVLRYSSEKMDPTNQQSVLAGVNNPIVYQQSQDITQVIIDRLGRVATQPSKTRVRQ